MSGRRGAGRDPGGHGDPSARRSGSGARGSGSAAGGRIFGVPSDRLWQAGFLVGSALGAAATIAGRRMERSARRGLVSWPEVERVAVASLRRAPGALTAAQLREAEAAYGEAMARIVPRLSEALGADLPGVVDRAAVVDRAGWCMPTSPRSRS